MKIAAVVYLAALLHCSGCGAPPPASIEAAKDPGIGLEQRLLSIARKIEGEGFRLWEMIDAGTVPHEERFSFTYKSTKDLRVVVLAIPSRPGADLDLAVLEPDGTVIAEDRTPSSRCAVVFPARRGKSLSVELSSRGGDTGAMIAVLTAPSINEPPLLTDIFDADPLQRDTRGPMAEVASSMGYTTIDARTVIRLRSGERGRVAVAATVNRCYLLGAEGSAGIDRISTRLSKDGRLVATDLSGRHHAWVSACAEEEGDMELQVMVEAGAGEVEIGVFLAEREDVLDRVGPPVVPRDNPVTMEVLMSGREREMLEAGYGERTVVFEGELRAGDREGFDTGIRDPTCAVVTAYADRTVTDIDLRLVSSLGRVFSDRSRGPISRVPVCAKPGESFKGEVIVLGGFGRSAVTVNALPPSGIPGMESTDSHPILEASAMFARVGMVPSPKQPSLDFDPESSAWESDLSLDGGSCHGVVVADGKSSILAMEIVAGDHSGGEWRWIGPGNKALITLCPPAPGTYHVLVEMENGTTDRAPRMVLYDTSKAKPVSDTGPDEKYNLVP